MVFRQQRASSGDRCSAAAAKLGKAPHFADGHPRSPQTLEERDPLEIARRVSTLAAEPSSDRRKQTRSLVVAQRVGAKPAPSGGFPDAHVLTLQVRQCARTAP